MSKLKAVDLFCGCGGMSAGLRMAGIEVVAGVDIEKKYISTFAENFPEARALVGDITKTSPSDFMNILDIKQGELDILVGGPPCQGFSKNVPRKFRQLDDPRNQLIKTFLDYCEALMPKIIIIENVAEMKRGFEDAYAIEIIDRLENQGYSVTADVFNAADFGIPQKRKRAFFIANRFGVKIKSPSRTHYEIKNLDESKHAQSPLISIYEPYVSVWEAIGDLPSLNHDDGDNDSTYKSTPQNKYQQLMRVNAEETIYNHIPRKLKDIQHSRLSSLKPGQGHKDLPPELQVASGYSGAYGRLTKEMTAPTITRWVFHPGSGRWGHPVDIRTITMRETARLQSFPDDYKFVGSYNDQAGQLGNAVPPLLSKTIIESVLSQVFSSEDFNKNSKSSSKSA